MMYRDLLEITGLVWNESPIERGTRLRIFIPMDGGTIEFIIDTQAGSQGVESAVASRMLNAQGDEIESDHRPHMTWWLYEIMKTLEDDVREKHAQQIGGRNEKT